ncbi:hypothetical protein OCA08_03370 [Bacillus cereus]|nr:hypothetical protein [Bacillus cereus]
MKSWLFSYENLFINQLFCKISDRDLLYLVDGIILQFAKGDEVLSNKEKKPNEATLAKQAIAALYQKETNSTPIIVSVNLAKFENGYAAITSEHIQCFKYDKTRNDIVSITIYPLQDFTNATVDHFAIKSVFHFKGQSQNFTFIPTEKGKEIETFIKTNTSIQFESIQRKWYQKILGFRSGKKWKMVVACLLYITIIGTIGNLISGKDDNNTVQPTSAEFETSKTEAIENAQKEEKAKADEEKKKQDAATQKEDKKIANTIEFNEESKKIALDQVKQNPLVKDAHIEVQGKKIIMAVIVNTSVNKEAAKEIGDNFVRNLGAFSGGKAPEKNYYGEIFDNYDLQIGVGSSPNDIIVQGAKVTSAKKITW